jgi:hypothetical protein
MLEFDSYITPDGVEYRLHTETTRWVLSTEGEGMPPIEYVTQRGPFQHGETVMDYFLKPRILQFVIHQKFCSRQAYWDGRQLLLNMLRPNRQAPGQIRPGILRKHFPSGLMWDLEVFVQEGPGFAPRLDQGWNEWSFKEIIRFYAPNPIMYDPRQLSMQVYSDVSQLMFPAVFPIFFGAMGGVNFLLYEGTWLEYPTITVTGPIQGFQIVNVTTDEKLALTNTLDPGDSMTIDLRYGAKTITHSDGSNLIGSLSSDSDLSTFHLAPHPEAPNGRNRLEIYGTGVNTSSKVEIKWYRRYIGR